ncbi:protein FATTY ACID EXPORT 3, chloroplastic-like isoform X1 [Silene latifolia]|uniref:protein FATTY ACID EXPORT 3, chloroplastic-like isoform X1 n=1 Tax=Silene latifolia TaxID=37657 RepID=UPI003D76C6E1
MAHSLSFSPASTQFRGQLQSFHPRRKTFTVAGISPLPQLKTFAPLTLPNIHRRYNSSIVAFAAPHEESKPSEGEVEQEKDNFEQAGKASQEAWNQVLASFKEQALKLQSVSQEAYEVYSKKAVVVLKETAETLKIQADQASQDLWVMAQELGEDSRQYLTVAAENSPEPVKDVVETFASAEDLDDVSKLQDFYVGIPYGTILSAGGFLNFMITGSTSALRFGVILGGILLALSVSSLRSWKKGQSTERALKGQAAIASILFLRDISLVFQGLTLVGLLKLIISGVVAAFFVYRIIYGNPESRPWIDGEASS